MVDKEKSLEVEEVSDDELKAVAGGRPIGAPDQEARVACSVFGEGWFWF